MRLVLIALVVCVGCGGKKQEAGEASCKDVETAMRRIEPERTQSLTAGVFERACRDKPNEYTATRRGCIVKAQSSDDLKACADGTNRAAPPAPAASTAPVGSIAMDSVKQVKSFGVELDAPADATVEERERNAHVGNGRFKLNLFAVDEYSLANAAAAKASLQKEKGFAKFTTEEVSGKTWRFVYELEGGKAGTNSRIIIGARSLDCGVHGVEPAVAAVVAAACAEARPLGGTKAAAVAASATAAKPSASPAKTSTTASSKPVAAPKGESDQEAIGRVMKANSAKFRSCYEKQLVKTPTLAGKVTVSFVIGADGRVTSSKASGMGNTAVESCAAGVVQRLVFPAPSKSPLAVNYPFVFQSA
jgi:hypothetical protein